MRPPTWLERAADRRLGRTPAAAQPAVDWRILVMLLLVPRRARWAHRWFAVRHGFFWSPCDLCGRPYGGHEYAGSIPDPTAEPAMLGRLYVGICAPCTKDRRAKGLTA
jgi:hypothetical protein